MSAELDQAYDRYYRERDALHVYPVEFVVRAFLGTYPRLRPDPERYRGGSALDLGFGDGRNVPLLHNLGLSVHGVEITPEICQAAVRRLAQLGIAFEARPGRNCAIPFDDKAFDVVLACHACYYVDPGTSFDDNIAEIGRVLQPGGRFVFSAPMADSYILKGARDLGGGHMEIANDPYGLRVGTILKCFKDEADLRMALDPHFTELAIGCCRNDFWGIEEYVWTVVCRRASEG